jgi:pimeloyl-ACP methyl ester carboxylesterase
MATDTIAFIETVVGRPVRMGGYSAGAAVALHVASQRPDLVDRLVSISGFFDASGVLVKPSAGGEPPAQLVAAYASVSPDGADHFAVVLAKVAQAATEESDLTPSSLQTITCPALIMLADNDIVSLEHNLELYRALPQAQLAVVPGASHLLLLEQAALCTQLVRQFLIPEARDGIKLAPGPAGE